MKNICLLLILLTGPCFAGSDKGEAALKAGDYSTALKVFRPLADQGDASAQYNLSLLYANGQGVPQDHAQAVLWYRKAADQGHADAQHNLGVLFADDCVGNCINGQGTRTQTNGTKYVGGFKNGKFEGLGTMTRISGDQYIGQFKDNEMLTKTEQTVIFKDGTKFVGNEEKGTMTFADGRKYVGEMNNGRINGKGTMTFVDGKKYVGEWRNGEIVRQGSADAFERRIEALTPLIVESIEREVEHQVEIEEDRRRREGQ